LQLNIVCFVVDECCRFPSDNHAKNERRKGKGEDQPCFFYDNFFFQKELEFFLVIKQPCFISYSTPLCVTAL